ncbi:MAG: ATP-binding cassette domain-containing protein [Saprospiraceae bacterium]
MITLQKILPHPLKESGFNPTTEIWNKDLSFEKGRKYLVIAPSGKGKSTLLHCIYGLRKDFDGTILLNDKNIKNYKSDELAELRQHKLSIVFQDLRLFEQLTAEENILLKTNLQDHKTLLQIKEMAEQLGVANLLKKPCGTLSFGQRQRIAIIRALCQPFDFLLLDEPFSHLDEANIKAATQLIEAECKAQGSSLILVSLGEEYYFNYTDRITL